MKADNISNNKKKKFYDKFIKYIEVCFLFYFLLLFNLTIFFFLIIIASASFPSRGGHLEGHIE